MDPLVFLVGGVALLTYALHGFNGMLTRDLAVYSYAGQQVAEGVPPYLGILNRAGPLAHVIPGIGVGIARIGGFDDVFTMRLLFMVIATACVCAVYVLGRDVFTSRLAGLVTAAAFLTFFGFIEYASNGPREKTPMTLFITLALWAVAKKALVHGRAVRQPGDAVPADRLLQLVRRSAGGGALPGPRRAAEGTAPGRRRWGRARRRAGGVVRASPDRCARRSTPSC